MALNPRRRILGVPLWAIGAALVALVLLALIGCLPGGERSREVAAQGDLDAPPTCGQWLVLSGDARRAFTEGFIERLRERELASQATPDELGEVLARCADLAPDTDTLELLVPLIAPGLYP